MLAPGTSADSSLVVSDEAGEVIRGVFEPPSGFVLAAIGRNKLIVCVVAVVLALVGTVYGLSRQTTYMASATLQVGQVNPNSPGFYSYVASAAALATAFSRAIAAEPVLAAVQRQLGLAPSKAVARLSSEPLPLSPAFRVIATGPTESGAIQLANVTANALIAYEGESNSSNPEAESLLHEYRLASLELQRATAHLERLSLSGGAHDAASVGVLGAAKAERETAAARLTAIGDAYTAAVTSQAPRSGLVSLLAGATSASNNRRSKVAIVGLVGLLAGIVVGVIAAVLREQRRIHVPLTTEADIETLHPAPI
jgi:capsular polysaccharide biosynthesis protein